MTETLPHRARGLGAEWDLLLESARPQQDLRRFSERLHAPIEWHSLIAVAEDHCVLGIAAARIANCDESVIPQEQREYLRTWRRAQTLFTMNLTAEMFRLFDRLVAAGIEAVVIKGPVLSARCYGDPGLRQYGDLDLIVRGGDILRVTELMLGCGYEASVPLAAVQARKIPGEYNFRQPATKLLIEFHTEGTFRYHPRLLPIEKLFGRQTRVKIDSHDVPALSPEDELLLICIHGAKHFWEQLSYVADVAAFLSRQELDWNRVVAAAEEVRAERMLRVGLRLAADLLGAPLPESMAAKVREDKAVGRLVSQIVQWLPAAGTARLGIFVRAMFRMRMRGGIFSGAAYLFRLSLSPTEDDWAEGAEDKRHWLRDAIGRPFRLAKKYGNDGKT